MKNIIYSLVGTTLLSTLLLAEEKPSFHGELRLGAVQTNSDTTSKATTIALGGSLFVEKAWQENWGTNFTLFSTNALGNQNEEGLFLGSHNQSYSIISEAYLWFKTEENQLKIGRQFIETPFVNSDDIGMVPNSYRAITLENHTFAQTTLTLLSLDKYAGVDSDIPERFTFAQASQEPLYAIGLLYEGIAQSTIQLWSYRFSHQTLSYFEANYTDNGLSYALQYSYQGDGNSAYGLQFSKEWESLSLTTSYNSVNGLVGNGLGGGAFFTSSEDHTIADTQDQKALHFGAEYSYNNLTLGASYTDFDKGENETDLSLMLQLTQETSFTLIYSDMEDDGTLTRFFAQYNF
jgi:hypothetical protein